MPPSIAARIERIAASNPATVDTIDRRSGKPKRIPTKIAQVVRLIISGECTTVKAAAERIGVSADHARASLAKAHVQAFIAQENAKTIAVGSMRAASRACELVDAESEHVSADMSRWILGVQGIRPAEDSRTNINIAIMPGYVIDVSDQRSAKMDDVAVIDAKPLNDKGGVRNE